MADSADARTKRAQSSRGRRKDATKAPDPTAAEDNDDEKLNIRVKERVEDTGKRSRIGGLLRETPIKGLLAEGTAETLKRPLTGVSNLFRRPASRSGRKPAEEDQSASDYRPTERAYSPQPPPRNPTPPPPLHLDEPGSSQPPHFSSYGFLSVDNMAAKRPYLANIDDVDISLLSHFLCTEEEVRDETVPWSWDYLYSTLCTEMREEWTLDR